MKKISYVFLVIMLFVLTVGWAQNRPDRRNTVNPSRDKKVQAQKMTKASDVKTTETKNLKKSGAQEQTKCPVCGENINRKISMYYKGYRVYFDKDSCRDIFFQDPQIYMENMKDENIVPERVLNYKPEQQAICPITGKKINRDYKIFVDSDDESIGSIFVYFSSPEAFEKFSGMGESERARVIKKLQDFGYKFEPGDTK